MNIPGELRYTKEHEWVSVDGQRARVGITDFAQDALGDVVFVQLPEAGDKVAAGDVLGEVESTKSVSEIYAPLAGTVAEVNMALEDSPELLNSEPYAQGWIVLLDIEDPTEVDGLMSAGEYAELTEG
ncbi:MAG: glycine cleavage system protein GcvH [Microthrixaceae bacterium]|nr:glycine cleavage system protein GcvH [Microthrixaceae bacterium]MCO5319345.1 glycine cleavage system protein GcvH [Microthrixaceae bacterium]